MEQNTGFKEVFLRLVAIVGLIAVLVLGAWGIILLAFNLVGIFSGTVHLGDLFKGSETATTTAVVITQDNSSGTTASGNTGSNTASKPAATQSGNTTAVYTAAPRTTDLYGYADLAVTITSVTSLSSYQGRTVVQFTVSNIGTNVARSGWSFNAQLPLNPAYTYQSAQQQALYPGDKIAYTLTYDDPNFYSYNNNYQTCTQQYPYTCYNNGSYYNPNYNYNQYPYNYSNSGTCYTFNGYQNVAGPCPLTYDSNGNPIYANNQYGYNYNYPYNQNYNYYNLSAQAGQYGYTYRTVTINLDPQNWVPESSEFNNTASKSF